MQNVSSSYLEKIKEPSRSFECRVTIGNNVYTNIDIINISIEDVQPSDGFTIGAAVSKSLELTLSTNNTIYSNSKVKLEIGLNIGSTFEYILIGNFHIEDIISTDYSTKLTCYDNMIKFEKPYFSNLGKTSSLKNIVNELATITGVEFTGSLPSYNLNKLEGFTCREILGFVASICGGNAYITRDGKFTIKTPATIDYSITSDNYIDLKSEEDLYKVGAITCKANDKELTKGTLSNSSMEIAFENPWVTESILTDIYNKLKGFEFIGYSMKWQGDFSLDVGDIISITDTKGNTRQVPIFSKKLTYNGGLTSEIGAKGESKTKNEFSPTGDLNNKVNRVVTDLLIVNKALINKADVEDLKAVNGEIDNLIAVNVTITGKLNAIEGEFGTLKANVGVIDKLTVTHTAQINDLKANSATINDLKVINAEISNLQADVGKIGILEADVGKINTLLAGNITGKNIQAGGITSDKLTIANGFITNAMIANLDVSKINAGDISTNKFKIKSDNGGIEIVGATQQFKDKNNKVRIQMGQDTQGNFNFIIRGEDGTTTLIDHTGIKEKAIADDLIKETMIAQDAIGEKQINYSSFITGFNKDTNTNTIKSTKIMLNNQNQTLDVAFSQLKTQADGTKELTESHSTTIGIMQGQINTAINNTQITKNGQTILLKDDYNRTVQTVDSMKSTIGSHTTTLDQHTGKITGVETRVNTVERDLNGIAARVSSTEKNVTTVTNTANSASDKATTAQNTANSATNLAKAMNNGKILYTDCNFRKGFNGVSKYANSNQANVTIKRIAKPSDCPSTSTYCIEIKHTGTSNPAFGGFYQNIQSRANAVFIQRFIAKVPVGYSLYTASNLMGTGYTDKWLTPSIGTGKWEEYIREIKCGSTGTFNNSGYVYLNGSPTPTTSAPVTWYLAYCTAIDITDNDESINDLTTEISSTKSKVSAIETSLSGITSRVSAVETNQTTTDGKVTSLETRMSSAESKITESAITNTVKKSFYTKSETESAITSKGYQTASQVQQTVNAFELKFQESGGYNLVYNSDFKNGDHLWSISSGAKYYFGTGNLNSPTGLGMAITGQSGTSLYAVQELTNTSYRQAKTFTLSGLVNISSTGTNDSTGAKFQLYVRVTYDDDTKKYHMCNIDESSLNKWQKVFVTFDLDTTKTVTDLRTTVSIQNTTKTIFVSQIMLEVGSMMSPWCPNSSEVYDGVTTIDKEGITVTASNVKSKTTISANGFKITKTDTNTDVFKVNSDARLSLIGDYTAYNGNRKAGYFGMNEIKFYNWWSDTNEEIAYFYGGKTNAGKRSADIIGKDMVSLGIGAPSNGKKVLEANSSVLDIYTNVDFNNAELSNVHKINYNGGIDTWINQVYIRYNQLNTNRSGGYLNLNYWKGGNVTGNVHVKVGNGNNDDAYGPLSCGNFKAYGTKNACVQTSIGYVDINAYETCDYYFGDIGETILDSEGYSYVYIDSIFSETVNTQRKYQVFLSVYGEGSANVVERTPIYFVIKGTPGIEVGYELKAKRKGYEDHRLEREVNNWKIGENHGLDEDYNHERIEFNKKIENIINEEVVKDIENETLQEFISSEVERSIENIELMKTIEEDIFNENIN